MDELTTDEELETLIKENKVVVCDFYTVGCGPCGIYSPKLSEFADELKENADIVFRKADCANLKMMSKAVNVERVPLTVFYVKGTPDARTVLGNKIDETRERVNAILVDIDAYAETMDPLIVKEVEKAKVSRKRKR
jgi:thiol-disulfide isomerase/thioredoxin